MRVYDHRHDLMPLEQVVYDLQTGTTVDQAAVPDEPKPAPAPVRLVQKIRIMRPRHVMLHGNDRAGRYKHSKMERRNVAGRIHPRCMWARKHIQAINQGG